MINPRQFINDILEPALRYTNLYSTDAMHLMVCTALTESKLTHVRAMQGQGLGLGLFNIKWEDYLDVVRILDGDRELRRLITLHTGRRNTIETPGVLIADIGFGALVARVRYAMAPEQIPSYKDIEAQADFYTRHYNSTADVNKTQEFIRYAKEIEGWIDIQTD